MDADNWYDPEHIDTLMELHKKTGSAVVTSARNLHRLDGTLLGKCPEVNGESFVDTNCLFLTRSAFNIVQVWWSMNPKYHPIDDRVIWANILERNLSRAHSVKATVAYRTAFDFHYLRFGESPPDGAKSGSEIWKILKETHDKKLQKLAVTVRITK